MRGEGGQGIEGVVWGSSEGGSSTSLYGLRSELSIITPSASPEVYTTATRMGLASSRGVLEQYNPHLTLRVREGNN